MKTRMILKMLVAVLGTLSAMATPGAAGATIVRATPSGSNRQVSTLDKSGTTGGRKNEAGSQVIDYSALTSPVSFKAEGKGLERIPQAPCRATS